jgi:IS30 family transposase
MERVLLERYLDDGLSLEKIGALVGKHSSTVGYWVKKHGLEAVGRKRHAPKGGVDRDRLALLAESGLTIQQIATELDRSYGNVQYWLRRHGLTSQRATQRAEAKKCVLLCSNCHAEVEAGIASLAA